MLYFIVVILSGIRSVWTWLSTRTVHIRLSTTPYDFETMASFLNGIVYNSRNFNAYNDFWCMYLYKCVKNFVIIFNAF